MFSESNVHVKSKNKKIEKKENQYQILHQVHEFKQQSQDIKNIPHNTWKKRT